MDFSTGHYPPKLRYLSFKQAHLTSQVVRGLADALSEMRLEHVVLSGNSGVPPVLHDLMDALSSTDSVTHLGEKNEATVHLVEHQRKIILSNRGEIFSAKSHHLLLLVNFIQCIKYMLDISHRLVELRYSGNRSTVAVRGDARVRSDGVSELVQLSAGRCRHTAVRTHCCRHARTHHHT